MQTLPKRLAALFVAALPLAFAGCASEPTIVDKADDVGDWINNPGAIPDVMVAVGSAPIIGNVSAARQRAEANGRAQMGATLQAQMQQMISNWFQEAGDMLEPDSFSSYINDEGLVRQVTDVELAGARPVKYEIHDDELGQKTQYVLIVLENPEQFVNNVGAGLKKKALQDETLFKTEVRKQEFEDKLNKLIEADAGGVKAATEQYLKDNDVQTN